MSDSGVTLLHVMRSILFTPADRPERFFKATASGADAIILDWEDGVPTSAKEYAREAVLAFLTGRDRSVPVGLRLNRLTSKDGLLDLLALGEAEVLPDFVALPKVESAAEVQIVLAQLAARGPVPPVVAFIESAAGLEQATPIAACPGVYALAFGGVDLAADLGAEFEWQSMLYARGRIVQAAAAASVIAWDVPFLASQDTEGLAEEARRVRELGFTAKLAIHPAQVEIINRALSPDPARVEMARKIVAADRDAGGKPCVVDGKMVDAPVVKSARRILALNERMNGTAQDGKE